MQRRDLAIGIAVLVILAGVVLLVQRRRQDIANNGLTSSPTPSLEDTQRDIEDRFNIDLPDTGEKAELKDPKGLGFSGIVNRDFGNGVFDMTVLADLPDPEAGKFYQVWIRKDGEDRLLGNMTTAKGGYLLDISKREDLTSFNQIVVSLESKNDQQIEEVVLEGGY